MTLWVKICGVTTVADARAAVRAGADALGVNFVETSRRRCSLDAAAQIVESVPPAVRVYGVFAGSTREQIADVIKRTAIGGVQFHGEEPDDDLLGWPVPVIRAVAVRDESDVRSAMERAGRVPGGRCRVLLDSARGGGSGVPFDHAAMQRAGLDLSETIVAGGLTPANVADVIGRLKPWGVDVAGGVEGGEPGVKVHSLIEEFVSNARSA